MVDYVTSGIAVNTPVYDIALGVGIVQAVDVNHTLPIKVKFTYGGVIVRYNALGELYPGAIQTLYYSAPTITGGTLPSVDWTKVAVGTAIQVSSDNVTFTGAIFIRYEPTNIAPYLASSVALPVASTAAFYPYATL